MFLSRFRKTQIFKFSSLTRVFDKPSVKDNYFMRKLTHIPVEMTLYAFITIAMQITETYILSLIPYFIICRKIYTLDSLKIFYENSVMNIEYNHDNKQIILRTPIEERNFQSNEFSIKQHTLLDQFLLKQEKVERMNGLFQEPKILELKINEENNPYYIDMEMNFTTDDMQLLKKILTKQIDNEIEEQVDQ